MWRTAEAIALAVAVAGSLAWAPDVRGQGACLTFLSKWGAPFSGSGEGQFNHPFGVDVDASGNVYVADGHNNRIQKFSNSGAFIAQWGGFGTGPGQFNLPIDVVLDRAGNIFVSDFANNRIQKFTSTGSFLSQWGTAGMGDGQLNAPLGVGIDVSGNVWVADAGNSRIQEFSNAGTFLFKFGSQGTGPGQFAGITSVAVDADGDVYVVDGGAYRIQKFTSNGTFLTMWGSQGSGPGQFGENALELIVDLAGDVYVSDRDRFTPSIQKFTNAGGFIGRWGSAGSGNGQFSGAFGMALDGAGNLFVADGAKLHNFTDPNNNRIQKFSTVCSAVPATSAWSLTTLAVALVVAGGLCIARVRAGPTPS